MKRETKEKQKEENNRVKEWSEWSLTPHTSEEVLAKFIKDPWSICLAYVCSSSILSEDVIEYISDHTRSDSGQDRLDWKAISQYMPLSEDFCLKHADDIDWGLLFKNSRCKFSREFRKENKHRIVDKLSADAKREKRIAEGKAKPKLPCYYDVATKTPKRKPKAILRSDQ